MQAKSNYFLISFILSITILLPGCAAGILGVPTSYSDRRTTESQITDEKLEWQTDLIVGLPILIIGAILVINQKIKTN